MKKCAVVLSFLPIGGIAMTDKTGPAGETDQITRKEYALASQVAHMYYDLGMLQPEIADKLFFSRSKISRLLKAAKDFGIVEINVRQVFDRARLVEDKLKSTFGLKDAVVITCFEGGDSDSGFHAVTDFAADYASDIIKGSQIIGLTNGATIQEMFRKLTRKNNCYLNVLQLMGSFSNIYMHAESRELISMLLDVYPGIGHYLNAPLYVSDPHVHDYLLAEPSNKMVFDMMKKCSIIFTGIGNLNIQENCKWYTYQTEKHFNELVKNKAVGSICAQYYDIEGCRVDSEWNDNCIAMPLSEIRRNKMTIGVASGSDRVDAILGALRGKLINVLISDSETATAVLKKHDSGK